MGQGFQLLLQRGLEDRLFFRHGPRALHRLLFDEDNGILPLARPGNLDGLLHGRANALPHHVIGRGEAQRAVEQDSNADAATLPRNHNVQYPILQELQLLPLLFVPGLSVGGPTLSGKVDGRINQIGVHLSTPPIGSGRLGSLHLKTFPRVPVPRAVDGSEPQMGANLRDLFMSARHLPPRRSSRSMGSEPSRLLGGGWLWG